MEHWKMGDKELAQNRTDFNEEKSNWERIQQALDKGQATALTQDDRSQLSGLVSGVLEQKRLAFLETRVQRVVTALFENKSNYSDKQNRNMPPKQWWWNDVSIKAWSENSDGSVSAELECYVGGGEYETLDFVVKAEWLDMSDEQLQKVLHEALAQDDARERNAEIARATSELEEAQRQLERARLNG